MQTLTQPTLLLKPFADSGDKNTIPATNTDTSNPQRADLTNGFPSITSDSPDQGGLPPERKDFNGLGYLTTTYDFFYQAGGTFTYNATIASAIGGYPQGARLWYDDGNGHTAILKSTKANNSDNFITTPSFIGTSWVAETPVLSWNNTWSGTNTFTGAVSLGSSATATKPSASDNSTKVATTSWVRTTGNGVVHTSSNETIAGNKSFTGTTTAVTPSSATDNSTKIATTAWVNSFFANATTKETLNGYIMPNYSAGVSISDGYVATSNGWIYLHTGAQRTATLKIDGTTVFDSGWSANYGSPDNSFVPIKKGSSVEISGAFTHIFYPCLGG